MIKYIISIALLLLALLIGHRAYGENAYIVNDLIDAIALSESTKKPLLLVFSAKWCGPCSALHKDLDDTDMLKILDDYIICFIDIDDHKDISKEFNVKSLPDSRIIDNKVEISTYIGYHGKQKFLTWFTNATKHK